jgi:tetratricopeptide (TPR) repeat protein
VFAALVATQHFLAGCSSPDEQAQAYYEKGQALFEAGEPVKAGLEFRNALQIKNTLAPAWYGLALVEEQRGNFEKVYGFLNNAIESNPKYLDALVKRAAILVAAKQMDRALAESAALLELAPDDPDVLALRATILLEAGNRDDALAQANRAMEKEQGHAGAARVLATERLKAGDAVKALEYADHGLAKHAHDVELRVLKMQALERQGRVAEVEEEIRRLIVQNPNKKEYRKGLVAYYLAAGRQDDAERELRAIVAADPADLAARLDVVRFLNSSKGREAADAELKAMLEREPANLDLRFAQVDYYLATGRRSAAEQVLEAMIAEQGPGKYGLQASTKLAALRLGEGDKPAAGKLVAEVLTVEPRNPDALLLRAVMAIERRALDDAIADLHTMLRDDPNSARVLALLAKAHDLAGSLDLAEDSYFRAYQAAPGQSVIGLEYAEFLVKRNKLQRAEEVLKAIFASSPNSARALTALVDVFENSGKPDEAEKFLRSVLAQQPDSQVARLRLGQLQLSQGKADAAEQTFRDAIARAPKDASGYRALAALQARQGKLDAVLATIEQGLAQVPGDFALRLTRAGIYQGQGKVDAAIAEYEGMLKDRPDAQVAANNLASLLADHRTDAASRKRALQLAEPLKASTIPHFQDTLGWVHYRLGEYDQAITALRKATDGAPNVAVFHYHLGMAYLANKDKAGAKRSLEKALELSAKQPLAQDKEIRETLAGLQ